jgi:DNA-binding GntR family transcriptional regulator
MAVRRPTEGGISSRPTLADRAYGEIRERILEGLYPLGHALSRRKLAAELGMSFLPVSEALQRLEHDGLVESRPRAGTRVRVPSAGESRERYQLREALETQSARLFTARATAAQQKRLMQWGARIDRLYAKTRTENSGWREMKHFQTDHRNFHLFIAEASGCHLLRLAIEREQVLIFNSLFDVATQPRNLPPTFHADLSAELCSGDAARADSAMRHHVTYGLQALLDSIGPRESTRWRASGNSVAPRHAR